MSKNILSNQPPKGMVDWLPEEFKVRQYIFNTWRSVCRTYGFEEYLTPLLENAEIYRAKSGADVGLKELMIFVDAGGRELALRPEMTPSVTRLVSRVYEEKPKPLKYFSIANFIRNERPQRGRNREFWQLNCDIFGSDNQNADIEILTLSLDIMLAFRPPRDSFILYLNNRKLIDGLLDLIKVPAADKIKVVRVLDKYLKLTQDNFIKSLSDLGLKNEAIDKILKFITARNLSELRKNLPELKTNKGLAELENIMAVLEELDYGDYLEFNPTVIRGFDYYDGLVFEVFDKHPDNNRALFGGGRYNGLAELFGVKSFPAVGIAPGDETTKLFLESWGLLDEISGAVAENYYLPLLSASLVTETQKLAKKMRSSGKNVELGLEIMKINKALEYANKKSLGQVIIFGEDEKSAGVYKIKDMASGAEKKFKL